MVTLTIKELPMYKISKYNIISRSIKDRGGFSGGLVVKNLSVYAGDVGSNPGWRRSPAGGNGNSFQ